MKFRSENARRIAGINVTPILDAIFILLLFFAVNTSFMAAGEIPVDLPNATTAEEAGDTVEIKIVVTRENEVAINDKTVSIDELDSELQAMYAATPNATIVIEADKDSLHGAVVTVIDSGRRAGFERFAIATEK